MEDPEEPGKHQITNQGPVQGQVSGNYNTVTIVYNFVIRGLEVLLRRGLFFRKHERREREREDNRKGLLERVRENWIERILQLYRDTWIELRLETQSDTLKNPLRSQVESEARFQVQATQKDPSPLPVSTSIIQSYDKGKQLLLLGEPGSGKTLLLLSLAQILLEQAQTEKEKPIPVYLHLATWTRQKLPLEEWVVGELKSFYDVPRQIGRRWVQDNELVLLLDGLDEIVDTVARVACIQAINKYVDLKGATSRLVVCCRYLEYQNLPQRLSLKQAVRILPLNEQEIEKHISRTKGQFLELNDALHENKNLADLARSPLMLNIFLRQTPQGTVDLARKPTSEEIVQNSLKHYVELANLTRKEKHWLTFLALQMKNDPLFYLESMRPNWLPKGPLRMIYLSLIGALFGAIIGMICFPILGAFIEGLTSFFEWFHPQSLDPEIAVPLLALPLGLLTGCLIGLFVGLLLPFKWVSIEPVEKAQLSWQRNVSEIVLFLVIGIVGELVCSPIKTYILAQHDFSIFIYRIERGWITAVPGGGVIWVMYEIMNALISSLAYAGSSFLSPSRRTQRPSFWGRVRKGGGVGLVIGLFDTLLSGFLGGPVYYNVTKPLLNEDLSTLKGAFIIGACSGLISWFAIGLLTIVTHEKLEEKSRQTVNQGIKRSLRYSIVSLVGFWVVFWGIFQVVSGLGSKMIEGIILGFAFCLIPGLLNGGAAYVKHVILRYLLYCGNWTPRNYPDFLDSLVVKEKRILQRIGGGYQFTHRILQQYFADMDSVPASQQKKLSNDQQYPHQRMIRILASIVMFLIIASFIFGGIHFGNQFSQNQLLYGKHLYTTSLDERNYAINTLGFIDESLSDAIYVFKQQVTDSVRLYRYYNPQSGDRIYTIDSAERQELLKSGYSDESQDHQMYVFTSRFLAHGFGSGETNFVPHELYRFNNSSLRDHLYCTEDVCTYRHLPGVGYISELGNNRIFVAKGPYVRGGQIAVRLYHLYHP